MMILKELLIVNFIICGFAFLFNAPLSSLPKAGFGGAMGWLAHLGTVSLTGSVIIGSFTGTLVIALLGEMFSIRDKKPMTVFIVPGIVPFVPGFGLYNTMLAILEQDYSMAASYGTDAFFVGLAIAFALTIMLSINTYRKSKKQNRQMKKERESDKCVETTLSESS
ncbi:threonine/serine exporter family protein [Anoxynatronum buryatiense]|uniref:Uncharacterized membrane protein YjjB, DUF3815 family n=1 Tax=Anoxynatronum buryatiense TaxID=489973 RepID=A0AA46AID5_9CLOT|nr:threonine/serine exporter family protein [Anoxynatronum buryatiense]SMP49272.1 Uncharacterized membrane protein YjjB, DUF3815 family [Anoxynatronum buryatiense]